MEAPRAWVAIEAAPTLGHHLIPARAAGVQLHLCVRIVRRIDPAEGLVVVVAAAVDAARLPWPPAADPAAACHPRVVLVHEVADVADPARVVDQRIEAGVGAERRDAVAEALLQILEVGTVGVFHHRLSLLGRNAQRDARLRVVVIDVLVVLRELLLAHGAADDEKPVQIEQVAVQVRHHGQRHRDALPLGLEHLRVAPLVPHALLVVAALRVVRLLARGEHLQATAADWSPQRLGPAAAPPRGQGGVAGRGEAAGGGGR